MKTHCRRLLLAASVAMIAAPAAAQNWDWSGFYVGVDAGFAGADVDVASTDTVNQLTNINPAGAQPITVVPGTTVALAGSDSDSNVTYGGVVGFLLQSGGLAYGLEADVQGPHDLATVTQNNALPGTLLSPASTLTQVRDADTRYSWTVRGRIGAALGRTLLYVAAGVAGASVEVDAANTYAIPAGTSPGGVVGPAIGPIVTTASQRRSMIGWTAGGGIEQLLGRFAIGLDARYADYGSKTFTFTNVAITRAGATTFPGAENGTGQIGPPNNDPRSDPGPTRIALSEWRVALRVMLRF